MIAPFLLVISCLLVGALFYLHGRCKALERSLRVIRAESARCLDSDAYKISLPKMSVDRLQGVSDIHQVLRTYYQELTEALNRMYTDCSFALCYRMDDKNEITPLSDGLLRVVVASTVDLVNSNYSDIAGAFERYGFHQTKASFIKTEEGSSVALWVATRRTDVSFDLLYAHCLQEVEHALQEAYRAMRSQMSSVSQESAKRHNQFLQQVSHDIRSPLNNIRSVLNLFLLEQHSKTSTELLSVAVKNIDAMSDIVETILEYSSQSAGHLKVFKEDFSLDTFLTDIVDSYSLEAKVKGLRIDVIGATNCIVQGDPRHIRRVLSNLVSNGIKYTPQGSLTIEISSEDQISIQVRDTGIGMTEKEVAQLFTPFSRFQRGLADGAGLGLVVAKQLVEANGGSLTARSIYGSGSIFTLTLPKGTKSSLYLSQTSIKSRGAQSVLLIDDDKDWLESLKRSLTARGYLVAFAFDIPEAIGLLQLSSFDFVISDWELKSGTPQMLPVEVYNRLLIVSGRDLQQIRCVIPQCMALQKPTSSDAILRWLAGELGELKAVA